MRGRLMGEQGDKFTNTMAHPIFTAAFTLHQTFPKLLENELQEKKKGGVFV